ncbi:MAG: HxlR family transcriptional regulator [Lysobacteraceae bacterium]|nr:MAG: HxlR family transcriptional regulator [Xanthomonadaceae bacterium]
MSDFGQFCPIALASEVLAQKWMLLVIRELNAGATRFNDIRRGVPRISPTLLKQRLTQLEAAGILFTRSLQGSRGVEYVLTESGLELKSVLGAVGQWGQRWARDISADDLDPGWLVWAMHRRLDQSLMPDDPVTLALEFVDGPAKQRFFWLVCSNKAVEVCVKPPGFETDLWIKTRVITLAEVWRGIRPIQPEIAAGRIDMRGSSDLQRQFPTWLMYSLFAGVERPPRSSLPLA